MNARATRAVLPHMNKQSAAHAADTKILDCVCSHAYQDARYGTGKRVHNPHKSKDGGTGYRCTVCGRSTVS